MGAAASVREGYSAKAFGEAAAQAGDYVEAGMFKMLYFDLGLFILCTART